MKCTDKKNKLRDRGHSENERIGLDLGRPGPYNIILKKANILKDNEIILISKYFYYLNFIIIFMKLHIQIINIIYV